jgi:Uma2 family endonuclease
MAVPELKHRFTVDDYHQMARAGILREDDRVELLEGEIIDMTPIGSRHNAAVDILTDRLTAALRGRAIVRVQGSIRLGIDTEPQPDVVVLAFRPDFYRDVVATAADTRLVIEVADASLAHDRGRKLPLYGRAGVAEFWIVDLVAGDITVYRAPAADGFADVQRVPRGGAVSLGAFPEVTLHVTDVVG